jgi:integrase
LTKHVVPAIGGIKLAKLRPAHVQVMLDTVKAGPRTTTHVYRVLGAALRHAVRIQLLGTNPAAGATPPRPGWPSLTVPEAADVRRMLDQSTGWLKTALTLSASTGMRRGEVLALQWRSVDLEAAVTRVEQAVEFVGSELQYFPPKTDRSRRTVSLPIGTVAMLKALRKDQAERRLLLGEDWQGTDLVVELGDGSPIHPELYTQRFRRLADRAGLLTVRLHDLRHFYASELLRRNVHPKVVSEALGHSSTWFTMDVYSHLLPHMQEQASAAIEAALGSPDGEG